MLPTYSFLIVALLCLVLWAGRSGAEEWNSCLGNCSSILSNRSCPIINGNCTCRPSNASNFCNPVDQQLLANLTGAWQPNTTDCCHCHSMQQYCCQRCNSTEPPQSTTAAAPTMTTAPPTYFVARIVWLLDCAKYKAQSNFTESYIAAMSELTKLNRALIAMNEFSCVSGNRPYCGVDVASVQSHHRARRLAAGGRAKMAGGGKKSGDDDDDNDNYLYNNVGVSLKCEGIAVNTTVVAGQDVLERLRGLVVNGTLVLSMWSGDISPVFMLSAMKGNLYSLHKVPAPPVPTPAEIEIPPLVTDLKPMMMGFGVAVVVIIMFLLCSCIRHTVLLKKSKFTDINSDKMEEKKGPTPEEILQAQEKEEEERKAREATEERRRLGPSYDMTHSSIPYGTNDSVRRYDWTTPAYLPSMLAPAPRASDLYGQAQPKLILDDIDSEDDKSSASEANIDEDEILCDETDSDEESSNVPRSPAPSVGSLYRKPTTPRPEVKSPADATRPVTAQSWRPGTAQSGKATTPAALVVREEAGIADDSSPAAERPSSRVSSATQSLSSSRSVEVSTPAAEEVVENPEQAGRPSTALSVHDEQRPRSALSASLGVEEASLPPVR